MVEAVALPRIVFERAAHDEPHHELDALRAGLEVRVIVDATRPVSVENGRRARDEMESAGAILEVEG